MKKPKQMNPILVFDTAPTRGKAITAMCAHCMGCTRDYVEVGFRASIRNCTSTGCPLYMYRPYQRREANESTGDEENASTHTA
jgi:hypothetical protein